MLIFALTCGLQWICYPFAESTDKITPSQTGGVCTCPCCLCVLDGSVCSWTIWASVRSIVQRQQWPRNSFPSTQTTPINRQKPQHGNDRERPSAQEDEHKSNTTETIHSAVLFEVPRMQLPVKIKKRIVDNGFPGRDDYVPDRVVVQGLRGPEQPRVRLQEGKHHPGNNLEQEEPDHKAPDDNHD